MSGKLLFKLYFLTLNLCFETSSTKTANYQGGLIFEQVNEEAININKNEIIFSKWANTDPLIRATKMANEHIEVYSQFCDHVKSRLENSDHPKTNKFFVLPEPYHLRLAKHECQKHKGSLPEIREFSDYTALETLMTDKKIKLVLSGMTYDSVSREMTFHSDNTFLPKITDKLFPAVQRPVSFKTISIFQKSKLLEIADKPIYYEKLHDKLQLSVYDTPEETYEKYPMDTWIICERENRLKGANQLFLRLTHHNCERDLKQLQLATEYVNRETQAVTTLNFTVPISKQRMKRAIPLVALGTGYLAAQTVASAMTNSAPLSWLGQPVASLFGFQTSANAKAQAEYIRKNALNIGELAINQQELIGKQNEMSQVFNNMTTWLEEQQEAVSLYMAEQDIKNNLKQLQILIQLSVTKFANILAFAAAGKSSPFALSQNELNELSKAHSTGLMQISTDMNEVKTKLIVQNETIHYVFSIPIRDEHSKFHMYIVKPMPLFTGEKVYEVQTDVTHIAIDKDFSHYTTLTPAEFDICSYKMNECTTSDLISNLNKESHCALTTFMYKNMTCPLHEIPIVPPFFTFYNNKTIYSVPHKMMITIKCEDNAERQTFEVEGTGEALIKPGCSMILPDGRKHQAKPNMGSYMIESGSVFDILSHANSISPKEQVALTNAYIPHFKKFSMIYNAAPSITQTALERLKDPVQNISIAALFLIFMAMLLVFILFLTCIGICTSKRFRTWLKSFCQCTRENKFYEDYRAELEKEQRINFIKRARNWLARKYSRNAQQSDANENPEPENPVFEPPPYWVRNTKEDKEFHEYSQVMQKAAENRYATLRREHQV